MLTPHDPPSGQRSDRPAAADERPAATVADYVAMARPDHWTKHIFIAPGIALAFILHPQDPAV
ncbi:MAG: hypothetical protein AAFY88_19995, partial [Acidobacteriota bacterium]